MTEKNKPSIFDKLSDAKNDLQFGIENNCPINPMSVYASEIVEICEAYDLVIAENERLKKDNECLKEVGLENKKNYAYMSEIYHSLHLEAVKLAEAFENHWEVYVAQRHKEFCYKTNGCYCPPLPEALSSFHTFLKKEKGES